MEHEDRYYLMMMDALDGELAADEHIELETHLRTCLDCSREWRTLTAIELLFRQAPILMPAIDFAGRTLARLPNRQARRAALGTIYTILLLSGIVPLLVALFLAARYAPVLSSPALLGGVWSSLAGAGRAATTVIEALMVGAGRFVIEQPILIGWFIILAGLVLLWGGVFQRLLLQPARVASRN
ncbi:MAG: zf-HC2 domain-containing protein [Candidatus Promineofilum sp.]|nr:zf-HC2 domain-containing protein [Promineifilum sp.]